MWDYDGIIEVYIDLNLMNIMPRNKVSTADNQQERLKTEGWISGYTDGEGCFTVSIVRNKRSRFGWQIFPEFVITQGEKSLESLEFVQKWFGCGNIFVNKRYDNHNENLYRYCVRSIKDLAEKVIPFFERNSLRTSKRKDFEKFCEIIHLMRYQKHFQKKGLIKIAKIAAEMNRKTPSKVLRILRDYTSDPALLDKVKRAGKI